MDLPARDGDQRTQAHLEELTDLRERNAELEAEKAERKRVEAALLESEERFRRIVENTQAIIFMIDREGIFLLSEGKGLAALGFKPGEAVGKSAFEMYRNYPEVIQGINDALQGKLHKAIIEVEGLTFDIFYSPYEDSAGNVSAVIGMAIDITERKRAEAEQRKLEAQMQHAQKLEGLGVLAGGIAHDFNNLLMAILGNADLALHDMGEDAPARAAVKEIVKAVHRAADLTRQMLAYSGKGQFIISAVNLSELVEEMAHLLEAFISKRIQLKMDLARGLPHIEADSAQIQQVIMNLITNASEAFGDEAQGLIAISTGATECSSEYLHDTYLKVKQAPGEYVYLEVTDTGCGMDEETKAKLFDPFFSTKFTGRGLGLAAVLGIVRGHAGALRIDSEPGKGTTFRVLFPAAHKAQKDAASECAKDGDWIPSGTILLVDDDAPVREIGKQMLERAGFSVLTAGDGREAIDVYHEKRDDIVCIVLDLTMPNMDGVATYHELRRLDANVPVVLSSGYSEQEVARRFAGKGLAGFIQKPYESKRLLEILQDVLER